VLKPTQTGLGERSHLPSKSIDLDACVTDIANVIRYEELNDVVLVGHSFGGNAISGVADIMRDRIRQLIYLDAVILENGQSVFTPLPVLREAWKWGARPDFRQQGCRTRPSRRAK
jgi:pimeloyl-ACP methyl ester carboxylesterase